MNAIIETYKAQVATYNAENGKKWTEWRDAEAVFYAIPFDWEKLNDEEGEQLFNAVFDAVEAGQ